MKKKYDEDQKPLLNSFRAGVIALVFLLLGFQLALFVHRAAETRILANRDEPDTVYVRVGDAGDFEDMDGGSGYVESRSGGGSGGGLSGGGSGGGLSGGGSGGGQTVRRNAEHDDKVERIRYERPPKKVESFRFDPNTVSVEDLVRLGFSPKQAESIDNYRQKGGRFRRKEDFKKSYVVADSVYERLAPYIYIPKIDLNKADSAAFDSLPGIGAWFAAKMVSYREELGGYSCKEQLMEIYNFDQEKFDGLKDLVTVGECEPFRLWSLPADSLKLHPHIHDWRTARAIVLYRENNPPELLTIDGLEAAGILDSTRAARLRLCKIE